MTFIPEPIERLDQTNREPEVAWGWREIGLVVGLVLGGTLLTALVLGIVARVTGMEVRDSLLSPINYVTAISFMGLMVLGVYLFAVRRSGWRALGLRPAPFKVFVATPGLVFIGLLGAALVNQIIIRVTGEELENPQVEALTGGQPLGGVQLVLILLLVSVMAPIAEEFLFRGMLYPVLRRHLGAVPAVIANAAIFAGAHLIWQLFPALFIIGLMLAFLREWSKSVYPCIIYHCLQNIFAVIAISLAMSAMQSSSLLK